MLAKLRKLDLISSKTSIFYYGLIFLEVVLCFAIVRKVACKLHSVHIFLSLIALDRE